MERICKNCEKWTDNKCGMGRFVKGPEDTCPACSTPDMSVEEWRANMIADARARALQAAKEEAAETKKAVVQPPIKRIPKALPKTVFADTTMQYMTAFGHQLEAIDKFKDMDEIALFFEMGCGKTFTSLKILEYKYLKGQIKGVLVIAPNGIHKQWYDDLVSGIMIDGVLRHEIAVSLDAQCVGGRGGQSELYPFEESDRFKFVSVNVDTFSTPHKWEPIVEWANSDNYAILIDESTVIKNPTAKRTERILYEFNDVVKRRKTILSSVKKHPVRIILTGTPTTNGPTDLWCMMEFVKPNFFGRNYYSFKSHYGMYTKFTVDTGREIPIPLTEKTWRGIHDCQDYMQASCLFGCSEDTYLTVKKQVKFQGPYKHLEELKAQLEPVSMFKKLTDCVDMPKTIYIERNVDMSTSQQAAYNNMKNKLLTEFSDHVATAMNKLVLSIRLQQISSGFIVGKKLEPSEDDNMFVDLEAGFDAADLMPNEVVWLDDQCPKLKQLLSDIDECDKPLLILTRYTAEADKIYNLCKDKYDTGLYTGWKIVGGIDDFKDGKLDVLVANSSKIARGFNLQIAHTTLFYSNTFSMEIRQQAEFRTFRMGQKHPCIYIDYTASDIDRTINSAIAMKKNLLEYIRNKNVEEII